MKFKKVILSGIIILISFLLDDIAMQFFSLIQHNTLTQIMGWFSNLITVFFVLIVMSGFFMYQERKTKYIVVLILSFFLAILSSYLLKFILMRTRPEGLITHTISIFNLLIIFNDYSFPSAHTMTVFSVLPVLDLEFKKIKPLWIFISLMIAVSRIYLNQHYLSDVVAGAIFGYFLGEFILKVEKKNGLAKRILQKV